MAKDERMKEMMINGGRSKGQGGGGAAPCAACKLLRRRCAEECVFAPYFPADQPHKFANVHKVFGASNVNKMLQVPFYYSLISTFNERNNSCIL